MVIHCKGGEAFKGLQPADHVRQLCPSLTAEFEHVSPSPGCQMLRLPR